jgi:integrase
MRRSSGEGSVYQRKTGPKKGLWVAEYRVAGKRRYLYGKTKKAVTDNLREKTSSIREGLDAEAEKLLIGEYLERWLPTVKGNVKERTWQRHEEIVRLHLKPTLGGVMLTKLSALDVQELYQMKLDAGLSPRTVQIVHTTLRKALSQALKWSLVPKNVTDSITPPKSQQKEIRVLTPEEVKRLLKAARGERFEALYILAVTTGMRQGELLGLKWGDVDLDEGVVRVRRTVWKGMSTAPKTAKANRSISLTEMAKETLKEQREKDGNSEWIFSTRNDTPVSCHNLINRSWGPETP